MNQQSHPAMNQQPAQQPASGMLQQPLDEHARQMLNSHGEHDRHMLNFFEQHHNHAGSGFPRRVPAPFAQHLLAQSSGVPQPPHLPTHPEHLPPTDFKHDVESIQQKMDIPAWKAREIVADLYVDRHDEMTHGHSSGPYHQASRYHERIHTGNPDVSAVYQVGGRSTRAVEPGHERTCWEASRGPNNGARARECLLGNGRNQRLGRTVPRTVPRMGQTLFQH